MTGRVLLNVDAGELPDEPDELYAAAHVVHVACGGHAGDEATMRRALEMCAAHGAIAGAHPSYADRAGFGRRAQAASPEDVFDLVQTQCAHLLAVARAAALLGGPQNVRRPGGLLRSIASVKAHGALYHAADRSRPIADAVVCAAVAALGTEVRVVGPPRGELAAAAARVGVAFDGEAFADRGVRADGSLVPRGEPGALLLDPGECAARAVALARADGDVATVCVHGDSPGAVAIAQAVRAALDGLAGGP